MTDPVTGGDTSSDAAGVGVWVPVAELAKMHGLARQVMYRKVERLIGAGQMESRPGERGVKLVSPAQYAKAIGETADLGRVQGAATRAQASPPPPAEPSAAGAGGAGGPVYTTEAARRMAVQADIAQLDLDERVRKLLRADDVRDVTARVGEEIVRVLDRLPQFADEVSEASNRDGAPGARVILKDITGRLRTGIADALEALVALAPAPQGDGGAAAE